MAFDSVDDGPVEIIDEGEPSHVKPNIQALLAPGWSSFSKPVDTVTVHNNFVGTDPPQPVRPDGRPLRRGLRRSASVSSQPISSK